MAIWRCLASIDIRQSRGGGYVGSHEILRTAIIDCQARPRSSVNGNEVKSGHTAVDCGYGYQSDEQGTTMLSREYNFSFSQVFHKKSVTPPFT